jgi:hypothetical protein
MNIRRFSMIIRAAEACMNERKDKNEDEEIQALMAEGYKEMAEEKLREAEEVFPLVSEIMLKYTQWDK